VRTQDQIPQRAVQISKQKDSLLPPQCRAGTQVRESLMVGMAYHEGHVRFSLSYDSTYVSKVEFLDPNL